MSGDPKIYQHVIITKTGKGKKLCITPTKELEGRSTGPLQNMEFYKISSQERWLCDRFFPSFHSMLSSDINNEIIQLKILGSHLYFIGFSSKEFTPLCQYNKQNIINSCNFE